MSQFPLNISHLTCLAAPVFPQVAEVVRVGVSMEVTCSDTFIISPQGVSDVPDDAGGHDGVDDGDGPHHDQHGLVQEAEDELLVWLGAELEADGPGGPEAAAGHAHVGSARVSGPRPRQTGVDGAGARVN